MQRTSEPALQMITLALCFRVPIFELFHQNESESTKCFNTDAVCSFVRMRSSKF